MKSSILLISNSCVNEGGYLTHYAEQIKELLNGIPLLLFVPYSSDCSKWDADTQKARVFFNNLGVGVLGVHQIPDERLLVELRATKAIFIDGDNTFQLLMELKRRNLLSLIRASVLSGEMNYIGACAGAKVACKTIRTKNDIDACDNELNGIDIFPFQIVSSCEENGTTLPVSGKTREDSPKDFNQVSNEPVIELLSGSYLRVDSAFAQTGEIYFGGNKSARICFKDRKPVEVASSTNLLWLQS